MARGTWCARLLALSALLPLVACGSDSVEPRRIPAAIVIIPNAPRVAQKATKQLTATVVDAAGREIDGETVAFASSDTTLITVSTTGLLVSVGPLGTATITVSDGELTGTVDAEVTLVPSSVTVTPNPIVLQRGLSQLLSAVVSDANGDPVAGAPLTFTSSDPTLVTVTDFGLVTSVGGDGSATITVTSNALSAAIPVSISQVPTSVVTNPKALVLSPGESQPISATVLDAVGQPIAGAPVTFQSSNAGIVTVSPAGLVHALTLGSATITVSSGSLTATVGVFVGDAPAGTILATVTVPGAPWGAAVASNGDFYVTTVGGSILRGRFPTFAFPTTFSVNSQALWIALNAAHTTAYVAQGYDGVENTGIAIVNIATNSVSDIIPIPSSTTSFAVALSKDEQTLFVGTGDRLLVIDVATRTIVNDNLIPGSVNAISRAAGSDLLYAATLGQVFEISGTARTVLRTLSVPVSSYQETAASLDGTELYVVVEGGDLIVWDLATDQLKRTVTGGGGFGLGLTPDGRFLYVADTYGSKVKIIDRVSGVILRSVNTGGTPRRVAFDPTTGTAMVTNEGGWVDFIK